MRYQEIKELLKQKISQMPLDAKLDGRVQLCTELETTRTTIDRAILELVAEGYLYTVKGSGTYVSSGANVNIPSKARATSWGVIVPNVMDRIYHSMVRGIENVAQEHNINVILCNSDANADKQKHYINRLIASDVSGFIIVPVVTSRFQDSFELYSQLLSTSIPFVFCNRGIEGIEVPVIASNDFYGGYIATLHLIEKKYRRIAYISKVRYKTSLDRCQGYLTALLETGIGVRRRDIFQGGDSRHRLAAYDTALQMLRGKDPPDAVFCFNDSVAVDVARAITDCGLRISEDVGLIGYDDTELCYTMSPALTSISYKSLEIGQTAAEQLLLRMAGEPLPQFPLYLYQPSLAIRESCLGKALSK